MSRYDGEVDNRGPERSGRREAGSQLAVRFRRCSPRHSSDDGISGRNSDDVKLHLNLTETRLSPLPVRRDASIAPSILANVRSGIAKDGLALAARDGVS
jgi:hypothetical protein